MKSVFLNGGFVAEEGARISIFDRSFLYGDGLFETLRSVGGKPFCWPLHWQRLQRGADFLKIKLPFSADDLLKFAEELIRKNETPDCVLRLQLSRGPGVRGYSIKGAEQPNLVMTVHPVPENPKSRTLIIASIRLPADDPLAEFKTCNKLHQIVARSEAEVAGADDALLLNTRGEIGETTSCNLFWIRKGSVFTPPQSSGILPGVTRGLVIDLCQKLKIRCEKQAGTTVDLRKAEEIFLTSSVLGVGQVSQLDDRKLSDCPTVARIAEAYQKGFVSAFPRVPAPKG
jgi:branched-chain amino acid aminotransferase